MGGGGGGTGRGVQGPAVRQPAPRNDPLTTGLSQTLRPHESKRIHSSHPAASPRRLASLSLFPPASPSFICSPLRPHPEEEERGPSAINLLSNNTGNVTHYWKGDGQNEPISYPIWVSPLQSQGHLGKKKGRRCGGRRETEREGKLVMKKGGHGEIFPAIDLLAGDMHRFLYVEDKCL